MSELQQAIKELSAFESARAKAVKDHAEAIKELDRQIASCKERIALRSAGLDLTLIDLARSVIYVTGDASEVRHGADSDQRRDNERSQAVRDAINSLAADGGSRLVKEYIGVKNYSGFGDQRSDHSYGMGPRHGSTVFSIGRKVRDRDLTPEEIEAALYYLLNIKHVQQAKAAA